MLEIFFIVLSFAVGRWIGIDQSNNKANEELDKFKSLWLDEKEKSESWERRYDNLLSNKRKTSKE